MTRRWDVLELLVKQYGWTRGAEIGVKTGVTYCHLLKRCTNLHMIGVDIFEPRPELEFEGGETHIDANLPGHEKRLRQIIAERYSNRAILIKGLSVEIAKTIIDESLDFVFIDADHRERSVLEDIAAWRPKIRVGGMLTGHDAQAKFPGVLNAINAVCSGWVQHPDSVWVYQC
jgi:hypothetical protein